MSLPPEPPHAHKRIIGLLTAVATVAVTVSTGIPPNPLQWIALIVGVVTLVAISSGAVGNGKPRGKHAAAARRSRFRIRRVVVVPALAALVLGMLGWMVAPRAGRVAEAAEVWWSGCEHPTMLRVLATPEGLESARRLAEEFQRHTTRGRHGCPSVRMHVYAEPPDEARVQLASGWPALDGGTYPRPDLWLPDSSWYVDEDLAGSTEDLIEVTKTVVAFSPLVLAVPAGDAAREVEGARHGRTWSQLLDMARDQGWGVARPDPVTSTVGRLASVAMYTDATHPDRVADFLRVRAVEQQVARGLDEGHYAQGSDASLLCQHRRAGTSPTAVIVSEQTMVRFNQGAPLGGRCGSPTAPVPESRILTAFYPFDTFALDHPVAAIRWSNTSRKQIDAAEAFTSWLRSTAGRSVMLSVGLRPERTPLSDPVSLRYGAVLGLGNKPSTRELPAKATVDRLMDTQRRAARSTRVLLVLDASGSMGEAVTGTGRSRFAVAAAGAKSALSYLGDRDEFGVWVFPGVDAPTRSLVPIGLTRERVGSATRTKAVASALDQVQPGGPTPLYRVVQEAVRAAGRSDVNRAAAVVILTDGQDQSANLTEGRLKAEVRDRKVRVFVVAVGDASCGRQGLAEIADGSGGACFDAQLRGMDKVLAELFRSLWGVS